MKIVIDNKDGNVWDVSDIVKNLRYNTARIGKASSLEFTLVDSGIYQDKKFKYQNGDIVQFTDGTNKVFMGYIFKFEMSLNGEAKITAYDQLRYLNASHTYVLNQVTATQVVQRIAKDFNLKTGKLVDTKYKIPNFLQDDQTLFDMICSALDSTLIKSGTNFVLYDDFGQLTLQNVSAMTYGFVIGEGSLMTNFNYSKSIDEDTYNQIVLYKDNEKSGKRETFIVKDSGRIKKWGLLQLYQSVDEDMNKAQINDLLTRLITAKNRETRKMRIDAIGDLRLRAGMYVNIQIQRFGINKLFLVDECTHSVEGTSHTMTLDLRMV
ncbi:XkdQ/YqbQ family protein [Paenibacillus solani]|uniref:XkdQ/YqbQ family protein n=1 Tax=Paenibacillus solani TaxID=1705565 RepID=UPI003D2BFDD0